MLGIVGSLVRSHPLLLRPRLRQNVLLVTIDTLRADALGVYGGPASTPNIDALARRGVRFTFAHAHAVTTLPSHASIMTGQYPFQHGVRDNSGYRLDASRATIASLLKTRGYLTAAFIGGFPLTARFGLNAGFDTYDDRVSGEGGPAGFRLAKRPAQAVIAAALAWIGGHTEPWFVWVHLFDPHAPYRPPPPFDREYASRPYYGEVAYADSALGALLKAVAATERPTLVVLTADHGEALGDHGELTHGLFAYESTLRVPLVVAELGPGSGSLASGDPKAGVVIGSPVRHVDVLPTILELTGISLPPGLPGRSLSATANDAGRHGDEVASYFEAMSASLNRGWAPLSGVVQGHEKFIRLPLPELYDLARDPSEAANLADADPQSRRRLDVRLENMHPTAPGARVRERAEVTRQLAALGYVSGSEAPRAGYRDGDDPKRLVELDREVQQGVALVEEGRLQDAANVYRQVVARRPTMALGYQHLAYVYWQLGQPDPAVATLRQALGRGIVTGDLRTQLGTYLAESGHAGEAIALLDVPAADVDALTALGIAFAQSGRLDRALATFERVLALDPNSAAALENIGSVHLRRRHFDLARDALTRALALDPTLSGAYTALGALESQTGHEAAAIEDWKRAVELNPTDFDALFNLATGLRTEGRTADAQPYLDRFVRTAPPAFYARDIERLRGIHPPAP